MDGRSFFAAMAAGFAAAGLLALTTPMRIAEGTLSDIRAAIFAPEATGAVVVAAVDEAAIAAMRADAGAGCGCRQPLDKAYLAGLAKQLDAMGASVIGVDLLLDDWTTPAERDVFLDTLAGLNAPIVALEQGQDWAGSSAAGDVIPARPELSEVDEWDGVLRRHHPAPKGAPSLPAAMAQALGAPIPAAPFPIRYRAARPQGRSVPVYSAALLDALPPEWIVGKAVLIGKMEPAGAEIGPQEDVHLTPLRFTNAYRGGMAGVEAHAAVLDQMLARDRWRVAGPAGALALLAAAAGLGALAGRRGGHWGAGAAWAGGALAASGGLGFAAAALGVLTPILSPAAAFAAAFIAADRIRASAIDADRKMFLKALEHYVPPGVIARLQAEPAFLSLSAERRFLTILMTDVQNFSALASQLEPAGLAAAMNAYFDGLIEIVWRHGAMVDKLIGDGLVAIFGAPQAVPDHAARAIACALEIDAFAQAFNAAAPARFGAAFGQTRIGVQSGAVQIGNFGGRRLFDYTAYGEPMVAANRLQALGKQLGRRVLIGGAAARGSGRADLVALGAMELRGVTGAVEVFAPPDQAPSR